MFNNKQGQGNRNINPASNNHDLSSGFNIQDSFINYNIYRDEISDCLELNEEDANIETINEYGEMAGQARGFNIYLQKASKAKLAAAKGLMNVMNTYATHNQQAIGMEAQLQTVEGRLVESLEKGLIDISYAQAQYNGFTQHASMAADIVIY
jgi:hypothetical protein